FLRVRLHRQNPEEEHPPPWRFSVTVPARRRRHADRARRCRGLLTDAAAGVRPASGLPRGAPGVQPRPHPRFLPHLPHRHVPRPGRGLPRRGSCRAGRHARFPLSLLPFRWPRRRQRRHRRARDRVRQHRRGARGGARWGEARGRRLRGRRPLAGPHRGAVPAGPRAVAAAGAVRVRRVRAVVGDQPPARGRPRSDGAAQRVGGAAPHRRPLVGASPRAGLALPAAGPAAVQRVAGRRVHAVRAGGPPELAPDGHARAPQLRGVRRGRGPAPRRGQHPRAPRHAARGAVGARVEAARGGRGRARRALPHGVARGRQAAPGRRQVRRGHRAALPRQRVDVRVAGGGRGGRVVVPAGRRGGHGGRGHRGGVPVGAVRGAGGLDGGAQGGVPGGRQVDGGGGHRHGEPRAGGLYVRAVPRGGGLWVRPAAVGVSVGAPGAAGFRGHDGVTEPAGGRVVAHHRQDVAATCRRRGRGPGRRAQAGHRRAARVRRARSGRRDAACYQSHVSHRVVCRARAARRAGGPQPSDSGWHGRTEQRPCGPAYDMAAWR
uniref:Uncharacterized protein n=1 Tax=Zea mays TaxID=4577 RepID=A0A804PVM5_MAIZE